MTLNSLPGCLLGLIFGLCLTACSDTEWSTTPTVPDDLQLSASTTPFVQATRADADAIAYRIYALLDFSKTWTDTSNYRADNDYLMTASGLYGTTSTSGGNISGTYLPSRFHQKTLYFYGITLSTTTDPAAVADAVTLNDAGSPCYHFSYQQTLPDVRVAYKKASVKDSDNGVVDLPFKHALAKLEFYISHPDSLYKEDVGYAWPDTFHLIQCSVTVPTGGSIDFNRLTNNASLTSALWTVDQTTQNVSVMAQDTTSFATTLQTITDETNGFLIFPCASFQLTLQEAEESTPQVKTVKISDTVGFEPNHVYKIILQYTRDGTFLVTVHPDYYDYVTEVATSLSLGSPTSFNGVLWADRNLGATSNSFANIEEWEEMRGYMYQVGRNIPYKPYPIKGACRTYTRADGSTYDWVQTVGNSKDASGDVAPYKDKGRYLYPYIPELWDSIPFYWEYASFTLRKGKSYYDFNQSGLTFYNKHKKPTTDISERVFVTPLEDPTLFLYLTIPDTVPGRATLTRTEYMDYMKQFLIVVNRGAKWTDKNSSQLWANNITPCPPGWRIPTDTEWKGIVPITTTTGDITYQDKVHTYCGDTCWYQFSSSDPVSPFSSIYYGHMPQGKTNGKDTKESGDIYIIKKYGTSSAYGLHIYVDKSLAAASTTTYPDTDPNSVKARCVLVIDRYTFSETPAKVTFNQDNPPTVEVGTNLIYSYDSNNASDTTRQKIYWYRVETLSFPICGVGHYDFGSLIWSGTEAQYATANGNFVRMKVGGNTTNRYVTYSPVGSNISLVSIRAVRDEAEIEW